MASSNQERIALDVEGVGSVDVAALSGQERVSTLFVYEARFRLDRAVPAQELVGRRVRATLRDAFEGERVVTGLITEAAVEALDHRDTAYSIVVRPAAFPLTLGRDCRPFHDLSVTGIAEAVLGKAGVPFRNAATQAYAVRPYTVQYRESDWVFLCRLFEEEGIYYWFDHDAESILTLSDRSPSAPEIEGGPELVFHDAAGLEATRACVVRLGPSQVAVPRRFSLGSFDPEKPMLKLVSGDGPGELESYDAPGAGAVDPATLEQRAKVMREEATARASGLRGDSPVVRLSPGRSFRVAGHTFSRLDGSYFVTALRFSLSGVGFARTGDDDAPIVVHFEAIPLDVPFRPPSVTPSPRQPGLQSGVVVGAPGVEVHPDGLGRVRVQQHWDRTGGRDDKAGYWSRVAQRGTSGSMLLPRVGWNVLSAAEEGSVDLPIVLNRTFDAEHPPPYPLPDAKTRVTYRTATTPGGGGFNELRFEDAKGAEEMYLHSTRDFNVLVNDNKTELVQATMLREVAVDHTLHVKTNYDVHIKGDQSVTIGGNQTETVTSDRKKYVGMNETVSIGGSRSFKSGANMMSTATSRTLGVGAAQIDTTLGPVAAQSTIVNVLVGGVVVKVTPRTMTETVGTAMTVSAALGQLGGAASGVVGAVSKLPGASALLGKLPSASVGAAFQTVGLLKCELGMERKIEVKKKLSERVLGAMTQIALLTYSDITTGKRSIKARAFLGKSKQITLTSPVKVTLKCGSTTLTVSADDGILLDTPSLELKTAALLDAKAKNIKHNDG